jgi:hypothetical protein
LYDLLKSVMAPQASGGHFVLGAVTGVVYWLSVFGLDTVKTRLMVDLAQEKPAFTSIWDCIQKLRVERGGSPWRVMFGPGLSAALIRAGPVNAVMLGTYAALQQKQ